MMLKSMQKFDFSCLDPIAAVQRFRAIVKERGAAVMTCSDMARVLFVRGRAVDLSSLPDDIRALKTVYLSNMPASVQWKRGS